MSSTLKSGWGFLLAGVLWCAAFSAHAESDDPPTRVARLAYLDGGVSFRPAGTEDWIEAGLNRPLTIGDSLWSDRDGRIEVQLDGSNLRLGTETSAGILNLADDATQIQLSSGTLIVHVRQLADAESYEIDTPTVAFSILRPGTYRVSVDANGGGTAIAVRSGQGEVVGNDGTGYTVRAGEYDTFAGTDQIIAASAALGPEDEFDAWSAARDSRFERSLSAQYVSPDVVGYEALDSQGNWDDTPDYGHVWFPAGVDAGWAPYQRGHWAYVAPWGYTWIDDRPWGFAPFHYGRWVYWRQRWGWVPVAPPAPRVAYVRPVYAPALVAWVGGGATVGWFPLGPREVYVPSYPVSRRYLNVVNVSNTQVNTTIINNVYNTTVINRTTVNNITYANRRVPGAVMATSARDFASARPVRRDGGADPRSLASGPVRAFAPAVVPTREAVYGGRGPASLRPSPAVQMRVTAARMAPAAAPPSLDARLQALRANGGRAPDRAQLGRDAAPAVSPAVRVVPPVRTLVSSRDFAGARALTPPPGNARPSANGRDQPAAPAPATAAGQPPAPRTAPAVDAPRRDVPATDPRRPSLEAQQAAQRQAQSQAQAELARRQQLDQQQRNTQLEQVQAQQRAQADMQARVQQQAQAQAEQQRTQQLERQHQLEQQVQQQRAAQLAQQQAQQRAQAETQARAQQQAQAQAEQLRNQQQQLERQREAGQQQYQRQQQALESQRETRERQAAQAQQQSQAQQQTRAREDAQARQQAVQRQVEQQRRPNTPAQPSQNPRQPH